MATCGRVELLQRTLASITRQRPSIIFETIVVDDSPGGEISAEVRKLVSSLWADNVRYARHERANGRNEYANPGPARNLGYRLARAPIVIAQSDDVYHETPDVIERLATGLQPGEFHIATVWNVRHNEAGEEYGGRELYSGPNDGRPLFFLGSLWRRDIFAVGGNCESFTRPGFEDCYFGKSLIHGLKLKPVFRSDVVGVHQHHRRPPLRRDYNAMREIWAAKITESERTGIWQSHSGPWAWSDE